MCNMKFTGAGTSEGAGAGAVCSVQSAVCTVQCTAGQRGNLAAQTR